MNEVVIARSQNYMTGFGSTDSVFGIDLSARESVDEVSNGDRKTWRQTSKSFYGESATTLEEDIRFVRGAVSNWTSPKTWTNRTINKGAAKAAIAQLSGLLHEGLLEDGSPHSVQCLLDVAFSDEPMITLSTLRETLTNKNLSRTVVYALCDAVGRVTSAKVEALALLTGLLRSDDASTRDAALLGISILDDPRAVPALVEALRREERQFLRETIESILSDA